MPSLKKSVIDSKKKRKYPKKDLYPELQYHANSKGLMNIFRGCKKIKLIAGRDFK
jgi:hypothetical protein